MSTRGEYSIINNLNKLRSNLQSLIKKVFFVCGCVCGRVAHVYSDAYHSHHTESVMHSNDTQDYSINVGNEHDRFVGMYVEGRQ